MNLTTQEFNALITLGRTGVQDDPDKIREFEQFVRNIEQRNGVNRYALLVRWQELNAPLPKLRDFPTVWPKEQQALIERNDRPIAMADVTALLYRSARRPDEVYVTRDLGGIVGWTKADAFFK